MQFKWALRSRAAAAPGIESACKLALQPWTQGLGVSRTRWGPCSNGAKWAHQVPVDTPAVEWQPYGTRAI